MTDPFGVNSLSKAVEPFARSVEIATKTACDGASAFLGKICMPAAEEFGLLMQDMLRNYRKQNAEQVAKRAEDRLNGSGGIGQRQADPKLIFKIIDESSWVSDPYLQDMWAGLLASSCTEGQNDDSNVSYLSTLTSITRPDAKIISHLCASCEKVTVHGLIAAIEINLTFSELLQISEVSSFYEVDRSLDHLRNLGLIGRSAKIGTDPNTDSIPLMPTSFALGMFVRCSGSRLTPPEFFSAEEVDSVGKYLREMRTKSFADAKENERRASGRPKIL